MTIKKALESLTIEQTKKIMRCFNEVEPLTILLEDEQFISVHTQPNVTYGVIEKSTYWLLGRFKCGTTE